MSTSESTNPNAAASTPDEDTWVNPADAIGTLSEDHIREALKAVVDPELFVNIIDLGLVYTVEVKDAVGDQQADKKNVKIEMTLTSPACPAGPQIIGQSKDVVRRMQSVGDVEIKLVMDPPWTPDRMTEDARDKLGIF